MNNVFVDILAYVLAGTSFFFFKGIGKALGPLSVCDWKKENTSDMQFKKYIYISYKFSVPYGFLKKVSV